MILVVDSNILFSAILRDSTVRKIIMTSPIRFMAPRYAFEEVYQHMGEICEKNGLSVSENEDFASILHDHMDIIETKQLLYHVEDAVKLMADIDVDDVPILAAAMCVKCDGLWSNDAHLEKQHQVKVWKTRELVHFIREIC